MCSTLLHATGLKLGQYEFSHLNDSGFEPCRLRRKYSNTRKICLHNDNQSLNSRDIAQAVSRRPLTAEARIRAQVSSCGICDGRSGSDTGFVCEFLVFLVNVILPWLYILRLYHHLGDKQ
jgi:hypothetical protein